MTITAETQASNAELEILEAMRVYKDYRSKLEESELRALEQELEKSIIYEVKHAKEPEPDGTFKSYRIWHGVNCDIAAKTLSEFKNYVYLPEIKEMYIFYDVAYQPIGVPYTEKLLQAYYGDKMKGPVFVSKKIDGSPGKELVTVKDHTEIIRKIQRMVTKPLNIFNPENPAPLYACANGILNLDTLELEDPSPKRYILSNSPVWWCGPDAECPVIDEFLDSNVDKEFHEPLRRWSGYTLWPSYNVHKALMLHGPRQAGKDVFAGLLARMHGIDNCSSVSLHSLMDNRFMGAELYGKKLNISGDVSANTIQDPSRFREMTGESLMTVERKNGQPFKMYNTAKMMALTNKITKLSPKVDDQDAFYGRWIIVPFPHSLP